MSHHGRNPCPLLPERASARMRSSTASAQVEWARCSRLVTRYVVNPSIAPDGSRVALNVADTQTTNTDIWLLGISSDSRQRLTFSAAEDSNAVWSADGTWIAYNTYDGGRQVIARPAASGRGEQLVVHRS